MKPGQTEHIGDGAYLHFDGYGFELRANHHDTPTDRVYIDGSCVLTLQRLIRETIEESNGDAHDPLANRTTANNDNRRN